MLPSLNLISKEELITKFREISSRGWVENVRGRNDGAVGNTLEDLLGIPENNLPIPNAAEWELKAQRSQTASLLTLFHLEPSPQAMKVVTTCLLPLYGWRSKGAGTKYPIDEKSFRATIRTTEFLDRGIKLRVNEQERRIEVAFDSSVTDARHSAWLKSVRERVGHIGNFDVVPYWGFDDLFHHAGTKLKNCFYVRADVKREGKGSNRKTYFWYNYVLQLSHFDQDKFIDAVRQGKVYVDFDARTHHNHGTKFRINYKHIPDLYRDVQVIIDCKNEKLNS